MGDPVRRQPPRPPNCVAAITCPMCGGPMPLLYGTHGWYYRCARFPFCNCRHSAHQMGVRAGQPLGRPADDETRAERVRAHKLFDSVWYHENPKISCRLRTQSYAWLAKRLGLTKDDCHIGLFDLKTCRKVKRLCTPDRIPKIRAEIQGIPQIEAAGLVSVGGQTGVNGCDDRRNPVSQASGGSTRSNGGA